MTRLPALHLGSPSVHGPVTVFPIWTDAPLAAGRSYRTAFPDADAVTEQDGGPSVGCVTATNTGDKPVLLFEGTVLDGGWQHRALARDVWVVPRSRANLPVFCVEARRWHGDRLQHLSDRRVPLAVRGALRGVRPDEGAYAGRRSADQGDVWRRVSRYEQEHGASATASLVDLQDRTRVRVDHARGRPVPLPAQRGVLLAVLGHPVLVEVFDHPKTLAEQWDAILESVDLDAAGAPFVPTPGHRARTFLRHVRDRGLTPVAGSELGELAEANDDLAASRALTLRGRVLHASAVNVRHRFVLAA